MAEVGKMSKGRLEAFSDGVIAIIITIMVLEMKVPHEASWDALQKLLPVFLSYVLSFIYVGIYWNNHHHLLHATNKVGGAVLWSNLHLLFWLSLMPFSAGWLGENHFASAPMALYGLILLMCGVAYYILAQALIKANGADSVVAKAIGQDRKGKISIVIYLLAIPLAFYQPWLAGVLYIAVAAMWLVPDRRIEKVLES